MIEKTVKKPRLIVNPKKLQQAAQQHIDTFDERSKDNN